MTPSVARPRITSIRPVWALAGGRVTFEGVNLVADMTVLPAVTLGGSPARIVRASSQAITVVVPTDAEGGHAPVRLEGALGETAFVELGYPVATGLHQVDSPVFDRDGALYVTHSGARGEQSPVALFRVGPDGFREPFVSGITNATSMAVSPDGRLYVSSRFEGTVYRIAPDGTYEATLTDLGVACGLAFSPDGTLYVGDRGGTIFRVPEGRGAKPFATIPPSVAAFHLAWGPDDALYVTSPTLATRDTVYRVDHAGKVESVCSRLGRPQGLAFDWSGALYVVEALAGVSGVYKVGQDGAATHVLAAGTVVGLAFDPGGGLVVVSSDTAYRFNLPLRPLDPGRHVG